MYGSFRRKFRDLTEPFVRDRLVVDVGCGDGQRAKWLAALGARVVMIDKEPRLRSPHVLRKNIRDAVGLVKFLRPDVVHLAWPTLDARFQNRPDADTALISILRIAPIVVYIGKNTDGTGCGSVALFEHFRKREVLVYEPRRDNVLIVYGATRVLPRIDVYHEELAFNRSNSSDDMPSFQISRHAGQNK